MTLHTDQIQIEVGVRDLHDHLSRYVRHVQSGAEIVVTMRGRPVARLVAVDGRDPLADLRTRGLVRDPIADRQLRSGRSRLPAAKPVATWDRTLNEAARETGRLLVNRTA